MVIESEHLPDSPDSFYLSDVSPKDKPWDIHRATADVVGHLYSTTDFTRYSIRIRECAQLLEFAFKASDAGEVALKLQLAKFCRVRFCPVCQWRRSLMWRARFFKALPKILEDNPKTRFVFLTLTVRNCELVELRNTLTKMNYAWKLLTKRKEFPATGFVKTVEVTRGIDGTAHPHFHAILAVKPSYFTHGYLSQAKWSELWRQCLDVDYVPIVNVQAIKPPKDITKYEGSNLDSAIVVALCETLKYSVKESDLSFDSTWLEQLTKQLHKTRAISLGGIFKEYLSEEDLSEPKTEDLIHTGLAEDEEATALTDHRVWFGWREMVQRYLKRCSTMD